MIVWLPMMFCIGVLLTAPAVATAQQQPWPGRVGVSFEAGLLGGYHLGGGDATLTPNRVPSTAERFVLFRTTSDVERSTGLRTTLGFRVMRILTLEGGFEFARPTVRTSITDDAEGVPPVTFAAERLSQYVIDISGMLHFDRFAFDGGRGRPFVRVGAGHLRQLHEDRVLLETGQLYHIGGGAEYLVGSWRERRLKGLAVRGDLRAALRFRGFDLEARRRTYGMGMIGLRALF